MKTKLFALIITMLFIAFQSLEAKPKALLRLNLEKGDTYQMTLSTDNNVNQEMMGQQIKIVQKMDMVTIYKVLDKLPDNNFVIEFSVLKMKMDMDLNGQKVLINTENTEENPFAKILNDIASLKLKITMNAMGKVLSVDGIEEYSQKIASNSQLAQSLSMLSNEDNFKANIEQYFGFYPEKEVEVGTKWDSSVKMPGTMNMDMAMHFNVADIQKDQVILDLNSDINMNSPIETNGIKIEMKVTGTQTGTMTVDRKSGLAGTSDLKQIFDMHMKMKNPQSGEDMEIPLKMTAATKLNTVKL